MAKDKTYRPDPPSAEDERSAPPEPSGVDPPSVEMIVEGHTPVAMADVFPGGQVCAESTLESILMEMLIVQQEQLSVLKQTLAISRHNLQTAQSSGLGSDTAESSLDTIASNEPFDSAPSLPPLQSTHTATIANNSADNDDRISASAVSQKSKQKEIAAEEDVNQTDATGVHANTNDSQPVASAPANSTALCISGGLPSKEPKANKSKSLFAMPMPKPPMPNVSYKKCPQCKLVNTHRKEWGVVLVAMVRLASSVIHQCHVSVLT